MATTFWKPLEWDTKSFGFSVAQIENVRIPTLHLPLARSELSKNSVKLAYWESPYGDLQSRAAAASVGGTLVNSRIVLEREVNSELPEVDRTRALRCPDHVQRIALEKLAVLSGWTSRFSVDRRFPRQIFEQLYRTWMRDSISGRLADAVIVAEKDGKIVGMITVSGQGKIGQIGLLSVAPEMRGHGLGRALLSDAINWFSREGVTTAKVVTQGENLNALTLYRSFGFTLSEHKDIYHFWSDN